MSQTPLPLGVQSCLRRFRNAGGAETLRRLYDKLPDTVCRRMGLCCSLLPPLAPMEITAWLNRLCLSEPAVRSAQASVLVDHFLCNAFERRPCPWALEGSCAIYGQRFFGCRAYGLWPADRYRKRSENARKQALAVERAWRDMGVRLPAEVLMPAPEYCANVTIAGDGSLEENMLDRIEARLHEPAGDENPPPEVLNCGGDISYLAAMLILGPDRCLAAKVEITRAALSGEAGLADSLRNQAKKLAVEWGEAFAE